MIDEEWPNPRQSVVPDVGRDDVVLVTVCSCITPMKIILEELFSYSYVSLDDINQGINGVEQCIPGPEDSIL